MERLTGTTDPEEQTTPPAALKAKGVEGLFAPPNQNPGDESASTATIPQIAATLDPRHLGFAPPDVGPDLRMNKIQEMQAFPLVPPGKQDLSPLGKIRDAELGSSISKEKPITVTQPDPSPLPKIEPVIVRSPVGPSIPKFLSPPPATIHHGIERSDSDINLNLRMQRVAASRSKSFEAFKQANPPTLLETMKDTANFLQKIFPQNKP